jgi:hypothetical protein
MSRYPKMYCVWLTIHVSDFCGNNVQLYYWNKGTHSPKCKCCRIMDKYTMHICRCLDPWHDEMFQILVGELTSWLIETLGKHSVASTVEMHLLARGEAKMSSCVHGANVNLVTLSVQTNRLGWDSFLEGRLPSHWLTVAAPLLRQRSHYLLPPVWGHLLISKLHNVIHKQWVYRNFYIHFKGDHGLTMPEQHDIIDRVVAYALIDPDTLLPRHRLLFKTDFKALFSGPASHCLLWLGDMDSALATSSLSQLGSLTPTAQAFFSAPSLP